MRDKPKAKGLLNRKLEDPEYRKQHDERYAAFKLEAQILLALEKKDWTYVDLAKATGTSKSNISRDLSGRGLERATFSRLHRMAEALDMKLVAIMVPQEKAESFVSKVEEWYRITTNPGEANIKSSQTTHIPISEQNTYSVLSCDESQITNFKSAGLDVIPLSTAA